MAGTGPHHSLSTNSISDFIGVCMWQMTTSAEGTQDTGVDSQVLIEIQR